MEVGDRAIRVTNATLSHIDPTRTTALRRRYRQAYNSRWREVRGLVRESIQEHHAFGFADPQRYPQLTHNIGPKEDVKHGSPDTLALGFASWLKQAMREIVAEERVNNQGEVLSRTEWQRRFIRSGYVKGLRHSLRRLSQQGIDVSNLDPDRLLRKPFFRKSLTRLIHRQYDLLHTAQLDTGNRIQQAIRKELIEGYAHQRTPAQMRRRLTTAINGAIRNGKNVGQLRTATIARTEIIRAHAESTLDLYEQTGQTKVQLKAEFTTAGDIRVCPICISWAGTTLPIKQARGIIPIHPNCRCTWLPVHTKEDLATNILIPVTGQLHTA